MLYMRLNFNLVASKNVVKSVKKCTAVTTFKYTK